MTANEMADELELELDRSSSNGSPGYEDLEITSILTKAERLYVKKFIDKKNNRKGESLEETEIRSQGLSALIQRGAILSLSTSQVGVITNGQFFDLPTNFMYCLHEEATIDKTLCDDEDTNIAPDIKVIGHDEISKLRKNKYKKPFYKSHGDALVWRLVFSREEDGYDPSTDKVQGVVLVDTTTSNDDMRGTDAALLSGSVTLTSGIIHADVKRWLGTAAATPTVAGVPEVDVTHASGGTTSVANWVLQYDGTGITGATFPATQAQVGDIALTHAVLEALLHREGPQASLQDSDIKPPHDGVLVI